MKKSKEKHRMLRGFDPASKPPVPELPPSIAFLAILLPRKDHGALGPRYEASSGDLTVRVGLTGEGYWSAVLEPKLHFTGSRLMVMQRAGPQEAVSALEKEALQFHGTMLHLLSAPYGTKRAKKVKHLRTTLPYADAIGKTTFTSKELKERKSKKQHEEE